MDCPIALHAPGRTGWVLPRPWHHYPGRPAPAAIGLPAHLRFSSFTRDWAGRLILAPTATETSAGSRSRRQAGDTAGRKSSVAGGALHAAVSLFELRSELPARTSAPAAVHERSASVARIGSGSSWWALIAIAVLAACGLAVTADTVIVNGDSLWHLVWGRALAGGTLETFATGPTPHPSLLALGAATSVFGDDASYTITYVLFGPLAFGVLIAAVFDVAQRLSSRWAAVLAVLIVGTSAGVVSYAAAARYDIAFAALVMAAVALETARPRRCVGPLVCLSRRGAHPARGLGSRGRVLAMADAAAVVVRAAADGRAGRPRPRALGADGRPGDGRPALLAARHRPGQRAALSPVHPVGEPRDGGTAPRLVPGHLPGAAADPGRAPAAARPAAGRAAATGCAGRHSRSLPALPVAGDVVERALPARAGLRARDPRGHDGGRRWAADPPARGRRAGARTAAVRPGGCPCRRVRHRLERCRDRARALRQHPRARRPPRGAERPARVPVGLASDREDAMVRLLLRSRAGGVRLGYLRPHPPGPLHRAGQRRGRESGTDPPALRRRRVIPRSRPGCEAGPRNGDWVLYVSPASACARGLL